MRAFVFPGQGGRVPEPPEELLGAIRRIVGERVPDQVKAFARAAQDAREAERMNLRPDVVAGHSLGEYGAAYAAGCFDLETGLWLVAQRDRFMAEAAEKTPGGMIAVLQTRPEEVERALEGMEGSVVAANYNSPRQTVISGVVDALGEAVSRLKAVRARAVRLNVSLAAHSPYVAAAGEKMREALNTVEFRRPQVPVISAMDGSVLESAEAVKAALEEQMVAPVRWVKVVETLTRLRVEEWVELGGGNTLTRMLRDFEISLRGVSLEELRSRLSQQAPNVNFGELRSRLSQQANNLLTRRNRGEE
ncbi:ACP S-malonyltransferase [Rubrobacter taiwanensis]|jgi:[acyl-carrier-protein] S-malonyltransferase|uniref:[acyl-carrier-protein] S-malonyltransferase n=1 Tax=Rubrobacter taiwanensis TaxID=185139 RepID=A0A4R1BTE9_9ACTN|nr:ACP S-malonyltransferase [Rubrobacter taiwanensis]TCJ20707.1 ACP S-malonyltransferase [Rubrobacter taiwanensis]